MSTSKRKITLDLNTKKPAWDDTFGLMSWWDTEKVKAAKVMVVGAGALGNEVLKNLALMNVGQILIVDFDKIEYHNLCRSVLFRVSDCEQENLKAEVAAKRIKQINGEIAVKTIQGDILIDVGLGVFRRMDAIIGCLDNRLARVAINQKCFKVNKSWIDGAIENLAGQINVYSTDASCYECQLGVSEIENIKTKLGCPDIARRNTANGRVPTTPISASIIGAMQVQEALKIIHNNEQQSLKGEKFVYEGMNVLTLRYKIEDEREDCESHILFENIITAKELSADNTVRETLDWLTKYFKDENAIIRLEHDIALELTAADSEKSYPIARSKPHISDDYIAQFQKIPGEEVYITKSTLTLDNTFPFMELSLKEIGIPYLDILTVVAQDDYHYVELSKDEQYLNFK